LGAVAPDAASERDEAVSTFAARWARSIAGTSYVPMELAEIESHLIVLTRRLFDAWNTEPFTSDPAREVGAALVDAHFTHPDTVGRTIALFVELLDSARSACRPSAATFAAAQGALAAGYAARLQERTLAEQDAILSAALTARAGAEDAARASEARFRAVFAGAAIGIGIGDTDGNILDANPALATMLGYSVSQMCGKNVSDFMHPADTDVLWNLYDQLIRGERESFQTTKQFLRSDGTGIWTQLTVSLIRDASGQPEFQVAVIEDVTDLHRLQNQLRHQADHDTLTGLPNRALFQHRLEGLIRNPAPGRRLGLCLLDLDGFKAINDSVGHAVGDRLLVELASRLDTLPNETDHLVARLGGDEFVILVEDTDGPQDVIAVAEHALTAVATPITIARRSYTVTASAGIVERPAAATDSADVVRAADITLYWAKSEGKNRWALFDPERSDREVAQYTLARMLPEALEKGQFRLHYQPIVALATGEPTGVEALLRWQHPRLGRLNPDLFIGAAEETEIIVPLGLWVLRTACAQARTWARSFPDPPCVSVNIALRQCADPELIEHVTRILAENDLLPSQLQLELTERALIGTDGAPLSVLQRLAAMGVQIAIDDFGTGYSNMTYLRRLPVSVVKLAASFIDELRAPAGMNTVDAQIVASLVSLAHTLGATVTAEGVETETQAAALRDIGCDTAQGIYFGPAGPPDYVDRLLGSQLRHHGSVSPRR
jgi:diguanylate cyclase (GGDEF)-like protein/PAS domain S-box-containing protein